MEAVPGSARAASFGTGIRRSAPDLSQPSFRRRPPRPEPLFAHTAPAPRVDAFLQCPTVDGQNPPQVSRDVVGTRMANTSETKSATPPDRRANLGPKPDPVPPENMCSQGHVVTEPKEEPRTPPNTPTADSFTEAPLAVPAQREPPPAVADSTADQPVRHGRDWSSAGKPHACHICRRRYCSVEWLRRHVVTHERGKPLKCDRCGRSYMMRPALAKHKANVHGM
ncbi:protein glass-like [Dermacentor albipictus]|uniref:protein glass-like n=1 Tax=Dermacentor albipictus TaxID=60249 RepID=UPI0031FBC87F